MTGVAVVQNLVVEVLDVNEAPTLLTLSGPQALPATVSGDYEVGIISVSDPDSGQTHTLVIKGPNSDLLVVSTAYPLSGNRLESDEESVFIGKGAVSIEIMQTSVTPAAPLGSTPLGQAVPPQRAWPPRAWPRYQL